MAWTSHGHQIPGTEELTIGRPPKVPCGNAPICVNCMLEVAKADKMQKWHEEVNCYNEGTRYKVYEALWKAGLTRSECNNAIEYMERAGILFREKLPYI